MHAFIFFSVYERLFDPVARELVQRYGVTRVSGFCWGRDQKAFLDQSDITYSPLSVFSEDVLPRVPSAPDIDYLARCEARYQMPINRIISAERHLLEGRTQDEVLALIEAIFRHVERSFEQHRPDFVFSENVSCMTSLIHHLVARANNIPFYSIGQSRISNPLIVSRDGLQDYAHVRDHFTALQTRSLTASERAAAIAFVETFRNRPVIPKGHEIHQRVPTLRRDDIAMLMGLVRKQGDPKNPTLVTPMRALANRARRLVRISLANATSVFEKSPPLDARYVLYPLHVQPEASTLVQAPYYLDQAVLIEDVARSLPVGYRLYVKEHGASRGRRPLGFYERIKSILGVHLIDASEPAWPLILNAAAIVVITGTMGWEGVLMQKPVVTFGTVFFNDVPFVYKGKDVPKDRWAEMFRTAIFEHRHDEELLLKFITALLAGTDEGEMHNPLTVPRVTEPENVRLLADALARRAGLTVRDKAHAATR
jgi:hypothetical protein